MSTIDPTLAGGMKTATLSEYDALAELFLGNGVGAAAQRSGDHASEPRTGGRGAARAVAVELLVMGHLPVQGSPWAGQYARMISQRAEEVVGLVRLRGGQGVVDVFGLGVHEVRSAANLQLAIAAVRDRVDRWLVRVEDGQETSIARDERVSNVTVLTGANEMAVVNVYKVIKEIVAAEGDEPTSLTAVIMGAEREAAESAGKRLRDAVSGFLHRDLDVVIGEERIMGGGFAPLFGGECSLGAGDLLAVLHAGADDSAERPEYLRPQPPSSHERSQQGVAEAADVPSEQSRDQAQDAVGFVDGMTRLDVPVRFDAWVSLAVDAAGRLVLVVDGRTALGEAVRGGLRAEDWLAAHSELVAMAAGATGRSVDPSVRPGVVMLVARAEDGVGLAARGWRRRLVARAETVVREGWASVPLD